VVQGSSVVVTLYLGDDEQLTLVGSSVAGTRNYPTPGGPTATRTSSGSLSWQFGDDHNTHLVAIDSGSAQTEIRRNMTPFGLNRGSAQTWIDNRAFVNQPFDTTGGLGLLGARNYDPGTGRFLQRDPVLLPDNPLLLSGYCYSANNPLTLSDPAGTRPLTDDDWRGTPTAVAQAAAPLADALSALANLGSLFTVLNAALKAVQGTPQDVGLRAVVHDGVPNTAKADPKPPCNAGVPYAPNVCYVTKSAPVKTGERTEDKDGYITTYAIYTQTVILQDKDGKDISVDNYTYEQVISRVKKPATCNGWQWGLAILGVVGGAAAIVGMVVVSVGAAAAAAPSGGLSVVGAWAGWIGAIAAFGGGVGGVIVCAN
jgi:RHS repeat-associated protein